MTSDEKKAQIERFKETARQLGCDEDEKAFDEKLARIVRHKPAVDRAPKDRADD